MNNLPFSTAPLPDESGLSWILRVTESNLLRGPWPLLQMLGVARPRVSHLSMDLGRVARFCGLDEHAVDAHRCVSLPGGRMVDFCGHHIKRHALRNGRPVVCPQCLESQGYARGIWDLRMVTACPVHHVQLTGCCSTCGAVLSWLRPRLGVCHCGAMLGKMVAEPLDDAGLAVSTALECAWARSTEPWISRLGPANELVLDIARMSLDEAQEMIKWLSRLAGGAKTSSLRADAQEISRLAGPILCDWPQSFHAALDAYIERNARRTRSGESVRGTDSPVNWVLLCRRDLRKFAVHYKREGESVLELEVIRYLRLRFADALLDTRVARAMRAVGIEPGWISMEEAARRLRIDRRTAYRLIEDGRLQGRSIQHGKGERYFVRTDQLTQDFAATRVLRLAAASRALGLPQVVIVALRSAGVLGQTGRAWRVSSLSEFDIEDFRRKWARVKSCARPKAAATTTLYEAFRSKTFGLNIAWKAEAIRRILDGRLPAYGLKSEPIVDATVSVGDLQRVKDEHRQKRLTLGGASQALRVSKLNLLKLLVDGHVDAVLSETEIGFERSEIARFSAHYVQVLKASGSAARVAEVTAFCDQHRIPVIRAGAGNCPTVFVPRASAGRVAWHMGKSFVTLDTPIASEKGFYFARRKGGRTTRSMPLGKGGAPDTIEATGKRAAASARRGRA